MINPDDPRNLQNLNQDSSLRLLTVEVLQSSVIHWFHINHKIHKYIYYLSYKFFCLLMVCYAIVKVWKFDLRNKGPVVSRGILSLVSKSLHGFKC